IFRIVRAREQGGDERKAIRLLRPRGERPKGARSRSAAEPRDELPPSHSITSSARRRKDSGIVSPIAFAVLRLTTSSNLVGCSTGMSAGFLPRKIMSTNSAERRNRPEKLAP